MVLLLLKESVEPMLDTLGTVKREELD